MELQDGGGVFEVAALAFAAVGLDQTKLIERFVELAGEAMAVLSERGDGLVGIDDVKGDGRFFAGWIGGAGEQIGFEERNAIEAPGGIGELADELGFGGGFGLVLVTELAVMILISGEVLPGQEGGAAGESVGESVKRRTLFAGFGSRAGGMLRIGAIDGVAMGRGALS